MLQPTEEQLAIIDAAKSSKDSILISALAGSAKTSTLVMIADAMQNVPILSLAFNRRVADEMKARLPSTCQSATLNSIGHRIWSASTSKRLVVEPKKSYGLLKAIFDDLPRGERGGIDFADTLRAITRAKSLGYIPEGKFPGKTGLISREELAETFEDEDPDFELVAAVLTESIVQAYAGKIDYDDQIYMPCLFGGTFPRFPLVLVDEAQDLSALNHEFLRKLVTQRAIAVGDRNQAIYAFRGALTNSMDQLRNQFSMTELPLTISFRCPRAVVRKAQEIVPSMRYPEWAEEGEIDNWTDWSADSLPPDAAVICRNNAPLFKLALALLRKGRGCKLVGSDLGPQLQRTLAKLGDDSLPQAKVLEAIARWEAERLKKSKARASITDKAECLRVFAGFGRTLGEAKSYLKKTFEAEGNVSLMSGHKSKGAEFRDVVFLDRWRIPSKWAESTEDLQQERNIQYVITTRAKHRLIFADMENFR